MNRSWIALPLRFFPFAALALTLAVAAGCQHVETRKMEVTGYCGCGECNCYTRGRWLYLKLNFWNRYITKGPQKGEPYTGKTASGTRLHTYHPGLFSLNSLSHPWWIPSRIVFFPWLMFESPGTVAADTNYIPFGTKLYIPGYGWGVVEDRGSAIKGPTRLDLYFPTHRACNRWGRQHVDVDIYWQD